MIKKDNIRLQVTLTNEQFTWLVEAAKIAKMSKTQYVRWCISRNYWMFKNWITAEEHKKLCEIAKTPWLDD